MAAALKTDAAHLYRFVRRDYGQMTDWEKGAYDQWNTTAGAIADALARDNPRFDRNRFLVAAGVQVQS